jgi:hypothetical protein
MASKRIDWNEEELVVMALERQVEESLLIDLRRKCHTARRSHET